MKFWRKILVCGLWFPLLFSVFMQSEHRAFASGYNLPDPPNTVSFETVVWKKISPPRHLVSPWCDHMYREQMADAFHKLWTRCQKIGGEESSPCQRALFQQCVHSARELQRMTASTCQRMSSASRAMWRLEAVYSQKTAQSSDVALNENARSAMNEVILKLEEDRSQLTKLEQLSSKIMKAAECKQSTSHVLYAASQLDLREQSRRTRALLAGVMEEKRSVADELERNQRTSEKSEKEMKSMVVTPSLAMSAPISQKKEEQNKVVFVQVAPVKRPAPFVPKPYDDDDKDKWIPLVAIGVPAAVLTAIVLSKSSSQTGEPAPPSLENPPSVPPAPTAPSSPDASTGDLTASDLSGPGHEGLKALGITVDQRFTDRQKATIAEAVAKIPDCHRPQLRGTHFQSRNLGGVSNGECTAGEYYPGSRVISLDPRCAGIQVGITDHEIFHLLGFKNGQALHRSYRAYYNSESRCPVTRYGGKSFYEDFAEAGRLVVFPPSGGKNNASCVERKLSGMSRAISCR